MELSQKNKMYTCKKCKGTGIYLIDKQYESECLYCKGTGKIDWIDNILGIEIPYINLIAFYIKKLVDNQIDKYKFDYNSEFAVNEIKNTIDTLKQNKLLYDYCISEIPNTIANKNVRHLTIKIKPRMSIDYINLKIVIKKDL